MTPDHFRKCLAALGLSQREAARLMGADDRRVRRWASGERAVPEAVERFLAKVMAAKAELLLALTEGHEKRPGGEAGPR